MAILIVLVLTVVICAVAARAARHVRHPENAGTHGEAARDSTSDRFYSRVDRPAGPDAEDPVGGAIRFERDAERG